MEVSAYQGTPFVQSVVLRLPISTLVSGGALNYGAYAVPLDSFSPALVEGAGSTMYFASHYNTSTLRVYSWPDGSATPTAFNVSHSADPPGGSLSCRTQASNANSNWCGRGDPRINMGWLGGGVIGFDWTAPQGSGGLGTFNYPYAHVVRIRESNRTLIDEPVMWSPSYAFAYPMIVPNSAGVLGGVVQFGGGSTYQSCAAMTQKSNTANAFWDVKTVVSGNVHTNAPKGGDYTTARRNAGSPTTWTGACYAPVNDSAHSHPFFVSFGGGSGGPPPGDTTPPSARAFASAGKHSTKKKRKLMRLLFTADDDSGEVRLALTVARGKKTIGRIGIPFTSVDGSVYFVRWKAPIQKGKLKFCVRAFDRAGHASASSCAGLKIR